MSAYVVYREHIIYLVKAAMSRRISKEHGMSWDRPPMTDAQKATCVLFNENQRTRTLSDSNKVAVANMLWQENIKSVMHRYPDDTTTTMPGPIGENYVITEGDFKMEWQAFEPLQILESIFCLDYQSCEHDEWLASEAFAFLQGLKDYAIRALPGLDKTEWGAPKPIGK